MQESRALWAILICATVPLVWSLSCSTSNNCLCFNNGEYEFQCPADKEEYIINVGLEKGLDKKIEIQCSNSVTRYSTDIMPDISVGDLDRFVLKYCPLPEPSFRKTMEKFNITNIKDMTLQTYCDSDIQYNITKEFFESLQNLQYLTFNLCKAKLEPDVLAKLPNLVKLDMATNDLHKIDSTMFKYTPKLRRLDISRNYIMHIPDRVFENLSDLKILHLWGNELSTLSNKTFTGLSKLSSLELSVNKILNMDVDVFAELVELVNISLRTNNLGEISSRIFRKNKALNNVRLGSNPNIKLNDYIFANLLNLTEVSIENSGLETLPEHLFEGSTSLKVIDLHNNKLRSIPEGIFDSLNLLQKLDLSHNKLETFPNKVFNSLQQLEGLNLEHNLLTNINEKLFSSLLSLKKLKLNNNRINTIDIRAFSKLGKLTDLDLSFNQYNLSSSESVQFYNLTSSERADLHPFGSNEFKYLTNLKLSYNDIDKFPSGILENYINLEMLDLSNNSIEYLSMTSLIAISNRRVVVNLSNNKISYINFLGMDTTARANMGDKYAPHDTATATTVDITGNPIKCDCYNFHLVQFLTGDLNPAIKTMVDIEMDNLKCALPNTFTHISLKDLRPRHMKCQLEDKGCPNRCYCEVRPADQCIVVNCQNSNLTEPPPIHLKTKYLNSLTTKLDSSNRDIENIEVHLEGNALGTAPYAGLGYENVTRLFLSNNQITNFTWIPQNVSVLALDQNKLKNIDTKVISMLNSSTNLKNLTLFSNPWSCGCSSLSLQTYLKSHFIKVNPNDVVCEDNKLLIEKKELCKSSAMIAMAIALPILIVICTAAVVTALYFYYQREIKIWLYAKNLCLWFVTEEELDKDKIYDVFISYSHKDEDFVIQNILPVLESGPNPFKICIHVRDWVPGEFIATQVTRSVLDSKRTLVVLSENFLESVWGKMEFRTAHTQAINEGRARVVVIKYGQINEEKLDDELKTYLKTNTYVEWGDPWFWNKLKYALPHTKKNNFYNNNQKHANIMLKIDDKFELTSSPNTHVESTPPVMSLDPSLLKNHPLNFNRSSTVIVTPPAEAPLVLNK